VARYNYRASEQFTSFIFESEGKRGRILKRVLFEPITSFNDDNNIEREIFNLAFGDIIEPTSEIDDKVVTDNGDMERVLATVGSIIYTFFDKHPIALVRFEGSTPARNRLYRMTINRWFDRLTLDFNILGLFQDEWRTFESNKNYEAILVFRKSPTFVYRY
jgi:hypothetical protein